MENDDYVPSDIEDNEDDDTCPSCGGTECRCGVDD